MKMLVSYFEDNPKEKEGYPLAAGGGFMGSREGGDEAPRVSVVA